MAIDDQTDEDRLYYRDFADAYARSLGVEPQVNRATGEHVYNIHALAKGLGISAEELFEQSAADEGCVVLVNMCDLEPVR